jgi:hypothetical protein
MTLSPCTGGVVAVAGLLMRPSLRRSCIWRWWSALAVMVWMMPSDVWRFGGGVVHVMVMSVPMVV